MDIIISFPVPHYRRFYDVFQIPYRLAKMLLLISCSIQHLNFFLLR